MFSLCYLPLSDRPRSFWLLAISLVVILLFAGLPVISVLIGCKLDEGNAHPCPFLGIDLGGLLYDLFVSGWFGLLTVPLGVILLMVWLVAAFAFAINHKRTHRG